MPLSADTGLLQRAVAYGLPAFEMARAIWNFAYDPAHPAPVNRLVHHRDLSDARTRGVTTPNNDTLYSTAVLDLSAGPLTLAVPRFGERFFFLTFMDAWSNNFATIGTRLGHGQGGRFLVVGPDSAARGDHVIRAPSRHVTALARIAVTGPGDYPVLHALQDRFNFSGPQPARPGLIQPVPDDGGNFLSVVNQVLADDPPPAADAPALRALAATGLGAAHPTGTQKTAWRDGFAAARASLLADSLHVFGTQDGWLYTPANIGVYGTDYRTRAAVALRGLAAAGSRDIAYSLTRQDRDGASFHGAHLYRLHLDAGTPPAHAFWSLTLYQPAPGGALYFYDNPHGVYALKSFGVTPNADGGIDIAITSQPQPGNWLPAPDGPFVLILRAYWPGAPLLDGRFRYHGVERLT